MLTVLLAASLALAQEPEPQKPYKLNHTVEEFSLPDLAEKSHALLAESQGKALVLVFWSLRDPVSRFYVPSLTELSEKHAGKLAVYLIDSNTDELASGSGDPLEKIRRYVAEEKVTLPVLVDRDNRVADDFGAIANGQVFLIDANRIVRYHGGIDDDPRGERRKKELPVQTWLADAVDIVLAGGRPEHSWTRPAGRPIKRASKSSAPGGSAGSND